MVLITFVIEKNTKLLFNHFCARFTIFQNKNIRDKIEFKIDGIEYYICTNATSSCCYVGG